MKPPHPPKVKLKTTNSLLKLAYTRLLMGFLGLSAIFFGAAGTLAYWQAWVYLLVLFTPMFFLIHYLAKNDPGLMERRLQTRERETRQQWLVLAAAVFLLAAFVLPGIDVRLGWSRVHPLVSLGAVVVVGFSYAFYFLVLKTNSYAARTVKTEEQQTLATSGPYALVRHPMYLAFILMYVFSPLALGSWWGILPTLLLPPVMAGRILNEEQILQRELKGYTEYMQKTKYRLFPGLW